MGNSALGWINAVKTATLAATSAEPLMPVTNLVSDQGAPSTGWQTLDGALAPVLTITPPARTTIRAVGVFRSNLTASASMIARLYLAQPATADLDLNFLAATLDPRVTFTRASAATYFDGAGVLQAVGANAARIDATRGLLIEEPRTNVLRNPRADGAVAGTPGTMPTYWSNSLFAGISSQVVGTGVESGIPYVDLRYFGTATGYSDLTLETASPVITAGTTYTLSMFVRLVAGSMANLSASTIMYGLPSFGENGGLTLAAISGAPLASQRFVASKTFATSTGISPRISLTAAGAIDVTLRIGLPQLELGSFATTPILPAIGAPAAATRATEIAVMSALGLTGQSLSIAVEAQDLGLGPASNVYVFSAAGQMVRAFFRNLGVEPAGSIEGTATAALDQAGNFTGAVFRHGITIQPGSISANVNGLAPLTTTITGTVASAWTSVNFGSDPAGSVAWNGYVRRWRHWSRALTSAELQVATDPGIGLVATSATIPVAYGQAVAVFPSDALADYATITLSDPTNPDNHINVPLVFVGPLWFPLTALSWTSTMGRDDISDTVTTRGGQVYSNMRATNRRWELALEGVRTTELFTQLDPLDRYARVGSNVLILPDVNSANLQYEATFGQLKPTADIAFPYSTTTRRSWRARVTERL